MTTLSSRHVSLSDHVKRRRSSSTNNNGGSSSALNNLGGGGNGGGTMLYSNIRLSSSESSSSTTCSQRNHRAERQIIQSASAAADSPITSRQVHSAQHYNKSVMCQEGIIERSYDAHAASYGNYDYPSRITGRSNARSNGVDGTVAAAATTTAGSRRGNYAGDATGEHACYAAESHIGGFPRGVVPGRREGLHGGGGGLYGANNNNTGEGGFYHSDPQMDIEGQSSDSNNCVDYPLRRRHEAHHHRGIQASGGSSRRQPPPLAWMRRESSCSNNSNWDSDFRMSQASTVPMGSGNQQIPQQQQWEDESQYSYDADDSHGGVTSQGGGSQFSGSRSPGSLGSGDNREEEDAIRQGIIDISTLIATYLAGGLSFVIGTL